MRSKEAALRRAARCLGLAFAFVIAGPGWAAAPVPTAEDFASQAQIDNVVVSPSGGRMALLTPAADGRSRLTVMDLDPIGAPRIVAEFSDANVRRVRWVNDDRLVFDVSQDGAVVKEWGGGTFAVNHDASDQVHLIAWAYHTDRDGSIIPSKILPWGWFFHSTVDDGSNDVFVYREIKDSRGDLSEFQLSRLDTKTRTIRSLSRSMPDGTRQWLLDANNEPRMIVARRDGRNKVFWRDSSGAAWVEVADFDPLGESGFTPLWVDEDGSIVVSARLDSDTTSLHRFDPKTRRIDPQPLVRVSGFDLTHILETDSKTQKLMGMHTVTDRPTSVWFDLAMQRLQQGIDAAMPKDRINRLYCGRCQSTRFFVVHSSSDRQPGEYFLFDRTKSTLQRLGRARPRIDEAAQGLRSFHRVAARDGLSVPVYVTHPPGADSAARAALPAVVLVHDGPWVRGASLRWKADAQFLATRGYRVLEPEFRGSSGYGFRHFRAGWKQWGAAMQDDLVDTVRWAAAQGLVDPARVCVVGASYGGYAALMAPIVHPGVFRCAASFAGVTDIELMYDIQWSDISEDSRRYGMPTLIGDPRKDEALLAAASPLKRVAELKIPVLVTHGGEDRRVPIEHSERFVSAARRAGVDVESHNYMEEGHGFFRPANEADHYRRLEKFLAKALQPARPAEASKTN